MRGREWKRCVRRNGGGGGGGAGMRGREWKRCVRRNGGGGGGGREWSRNEGEGVEKVCEKEIGGDRERFIFKALKLRYAHPTLP